MQGPMNRPTTVHWVKVSAHCSRAIYGAAHVQVVCDYRKMMNSGARYPSAPREIEMTQGLVTGWIETPAGKVPQVSARLNRSDRLGGFKVRWTIGREGYMVPAGLYAVGVPTRDSMVLVTANYKLSFDALRRELAGIDAWILVLDTKGINVWCAAGKGTFGTGELVNRVKAAGLGDVVSHRRLIVPQLGATGVSAGEVKKLSGFSVAYGPVRAADIPAFLAAGMRATPEMRRVRFSFKDRLVLVPAELASVKTYLVLTIAAFFILSGLTRSGYSPDAVLQVGMRSMINLLLACAAGTALGPLLLPWLPGRSFSMKGFFAGLAACVVCFASGLAGEGGVEMAGWMLLIAALSSFLTMNFTGASTYTSLSGVKKEMRTALPLQLAGAVGGMGLWIAARFL